MTLQRRMLLRRAMYECLNHFGLSSTDSLVFDTVCRDFQDLPGVMCNTNPALPMILQVDLCYLYR